MEVFLHPQVVRSQTSTPEASPVHRPAKDISVNISFGASFPGDKNPAPSTSSGGFTSWFPGMRSTNAQSSSDRASAVVGPTKSSATEELVSDNFTKFCKGLRVLPSSYQFGTAHEHANVKTRGYLLLRSRIATSLLDWQGNKQLHS